MPDETRAKTDKGDLATMTTGDAGEPVFAREIFFEYLELLGITCIFGNPGTTELPLVDGCNDHPSVRYVMSLHEDVAVAQAMGYARASGGIGVVNLHVAPGVAHGLGNLYNAYRARIPLLVTAGQHHTGLMVHEPILTADLAAMVAPFTKWAYEVRSLDELPVALQRAFKELTTPPLAPVFLSLPMNLLLERSPSASSVQVSRIAPVVASADAVGQAAKILTSATNPVLLAGDGVGHARAWAELADLAEMLGATVYTEGYATLWNFPVDHPHYAGPMPNRATEMRAVFEGVDVVLMCGVTSQAPVSRYDGGGPLVPWRVRTVAVDDSPWELGKNQPVAVGLLGDIRANLEALRAAVRREPPAASDVAGRAEAAASASARRRTARDARIVEARASSTITPVLVAAELRDQLPPDAVMVDESISNRPSFVDVLRFDDPLAYFSANGLSLGYSGGAAIGIQMALPQRRVVAVVGDGSLLYYPHALWSAASNDAPVLFVVLNNGSYRVLELIVDRMGGPWGRNGDPTPGLTIGNPAVDFVDVARAFGVEGERVTTPTELPVALKRGLASTRPYLLDVVLDQ